MSDDPIDIRRVTPEEKYEYLSQSVLFAGLSLKEQKTFEELTATSTCRRGQVVFRADDSPDALYLLKRGSVRLVRHGDDGRPLIVAILDPGAVFGESRLLGQASASVAAEAIDECLVCTVPTDQMRELIQRFPQIGLNLLEYLGDRLRRSHELSHEMAYWNVRRRLANQIALLADRYGKPTMTGETMIGRVFTQAELAEMVGATRQTVSELLAAMTRMEILGRRRRRIVIRDPAALDDYGREQTAGLSVDGGPEQ